VRCVPFSVFSFQFSVSVSDYCEMPMFLHAAAATLTPCRVVFVFDRDLRTAAASSDEELQYAFSFQHNVMSSIIRQ
jgi:hypothetical protein